jgi:hypothetical protein
MKKLLIFLILSKAVSGSEWSDLCPSRSQTAAFLIALFLTPVSGQSAPDNCTSFSYPPFTLTDGQTYAMAWWQISTGIFASCMILNNFIAPWYFAKKAQKEKVRILQEHINFIETDCERIQKNNEYTQSVLTAMRKILTREQ